MAEACVTRRGRDGRCGAAAAWRWVPRTDEARATEAEKGAQLFCADCHRWLVRSGGYHNQTDWEWVVSGAGQVASAPVPLTEAEVDELAATRWTGLSSAYSPPEMVGGIRVALAHRAAAEVRRLRARVKELEVR